MNRFEKQLMIIEDKEKIDEVLIEYHWTLNKKIILQKRFGQKFVIYPDLSSKSACFCPTDNKIKKLIKIKKTNENKIKKLIFSESDQNIRISDFFKIGMNILT
ncbi:hypothetical protein BpHYR1_014012 [Brachionus plicatilis]|uniref:Uncharacterized protein n=1 Tax=Brachionus plicatilis TaxID=10195 RepID=A0A3M7QTG4_BRAPC|nr:hypothetical protein BpHYR1_014012 [Brachionus plicatilis]